MLALAAHNILRMLNKKNIERNNFKLKNWIDINCIISTLYTYLYSLTNDKGSLKQWTKKNYKQTESNQCLNLHFFLFLKLSILHHEDIYINIHILERAMSPIQSYLSPFSSQANIKDLCGICSKVFWNMNWEMIDTWKTRYSREWRSGERRHRLEFN